ncbi:hypothetical protein MLDJOKPK_00139 [Salmonella phage SPAsTU]|nr:hypothetical protein STsAS_010 [Salmonella phage STsAS]AWN09069.1 hypothetical protein MLDJOKPK_00139 [Salmonella phage SPAsTU]
MTQEKTFNGVPLSQMDDKMRFEYEKLTAIEQDLVEGQFVCSTFTEAQFRRQGLPLLTGMLDDTFNDEAWTDYVGSAFVPLQIVDDMDNTTLLFTIPALLNTGRSLVTVPNEPSLSDETENIRLQAEIIPTVGEKQMYQMIDYTLTGIENMSLAENSVRAKYIIDLLNWIFRRYKVGGQLEYPEGLVEYVDRITGGKASGNAKKAEVQQNPTPQPTVGIGDGEDY